MSRAGSSREPGLESEQLEQPELAVTRATSNAAQRMLKPPDNRASCAAVMGDRTDPRRRPLRGMGRGKNPDGARDPYR